MPRFVPILEFLHEVKAASDATDARGAGHDVQRAWQTLPLERQVAFLARQGLPPDPALVRGASLVRRRGRAESAESLYVRFDLRDGDGEGRFAQWRDRLVFAEVPEVPGGLGEVPTDTRFVRIGPPEVDVLRALDDAWGGPAYDLERDGTLCSIRRADAGEIERYWVAPPFAAVTVRRERDGRLTYNLHEPELTPLERALLTTLNERLRDELTLEDIDPAERPNRLIALVLQKLKTFRFRAERRSAYKVAYYFVRNYLGYGRLDPIMRDERVEDVSCNGAQLPVYVVHATHQNLPVNLAFEEMELNSLAVKLAQRGGKLLSFASPLVDATLPGGSRIQASIGREVTSRGSSFTIRKFREDPLTCVDLIRGGTHTVDTMAYLWLAVDLKLNLLVMGATASGKTTTLNCLSQFIPHEQKIVSIEDTREITLQHENWLASVTRDGFTKDTAERITMYELLRAALRQRPEYILVGEIRGVEGLTLFQAMSTGHTCMSTMHAGSVENAVYRLENPPIGVPRVMLTSLNLMLLQGQTEVDGVQVRRMLSLTEVNGLDPTTRNLRTNGLFEWKGDSDTLESVGSSAAVEAARDRRGWSRARVAEELDARAAVLQGLVDRGERHYLAVAEAVHAYYDRMHADDAADDEVPDFELAEATS